MSAVNNLLDKYREVCAIGSDSALADAMGVRRQAVHQWRKGLSYPSEDHIMKMATAVAESPERWFVEINADRASPAAKKVWLRLAKLATAAVLVLAFGRLNVSTAVAQGMDSAAHNRSECILCKLAKGQHSSPPCLPSCYV